MPDKKKQGFREVAPSKFACRAAGVQAGTGQKDARETARTAVAPPHYQAWAGDLCLLILHEPSACSGNSNGSGNGDGGSGSGNVNGFSEVKCMLTLSLLSVACYVHCKLACDKK